MTDLLARLKNVARSGEGWSARCPAHADEHNSLSIAFRSGRWLICCHAGCAFQAIIDAIGIEAAELFVENNGAGGSIIPVYNRATAQPHQIVDRPDLHLEPEQSGAGEQGASGLTLEEYARAKGLPVNFLKSLGLSQFTYDGKPALRIPYWGAAGEELAVRFRIALEGDRFRWKAGAKPCLYGVNRLADAQKAGMVVLVEGESDCHALWSHGVPALGISGATNWREERDAPLLHGVETIYVVVEPDHGGKAVKEWLSRSSIRPRVKLLHLPVKDPSALHLQDTNGFKEAWSVALLGAVPWTAVEAETQIEERAEAWQQCSGLATSEDILRAFEVALRRAGVVGEVRLAKLLYLAVTSRLLDRPVSIAVKGPSSGGKSFIVESILKFFPPEAFHALTAMSERALAYSTEPLRHRHLVLYEAAGMTGEFATYLIRSMLSEGRLRYETVEKTRDGLVPKIIEREGPTGLIVTTTSLRLHPENETRMLSLTVTDTREQTAAVFKVLAKESGESIDLGCWRALQNWLSTSPAKVTIPFAPQLAELVPAVAVRLRRDFKTVLMLIRANALLHQATRQKDAEGRIIAELTDYAAVRDLVADLVAEGAEATIKPETREVVKAVADLIASGRDEVTQTELRKVLPLDKSVISRRVAAALEAGVLRNREDRKGRPDRLVLGDALPDELEILPRPERLHGCVVGSELERPQSRSLGDQLHGCMVAGGVEHPHPSSRITTEARDHANGSTSVSLEPGSGREEPVRHDVSAKGKVQNIDIDPAPPPTGPMASAGEVEAAPAQRASTFWRKAL